MQVRQAGHSQVDYWDRVAPEKEFSLPLRKDWLSRYPAAPSRIVDVGCGYGRTLGPLLGDGYGHVVGVDVSSRMLARARARIPGLPLVRSDGETIPLRSNTADLVLLIAVLTSLPGDEEQRSLLAEIRRILRPGGLLYLSDFLMNDDARNRERYRLYASKYGTYGVFELPEGITLRHHSRRWICELTRSFDRLEYQAFVATTMNGHPSAAFQYLGRSSPLR